MRGVSSRYQNKKTVNKAWISKVLHSAVILGVCTVFNPGAISIAYADAGEENNKPQVQVIRHAPNSDNAIALTFDDGPSATFTPQILGLLQKYHAKATFFVIGNRVDQFPQLIKEELDEHNEIGNHSYSHIVLQRVSTSKVTTELSQGQQALIRVTGHDTPHLFRPPRGRFGESVLKAANQNGYKVILWSVDSGDWNNPGASFIVKHVLHDVKNGDILLFHDQGGNRSQTVSALEGILPELQRRGFKLVTVSELLQKSSQSPSDSK